MAVTVKELKPNVEKLSIDSKLYDPLYAEIFDKYSVLRGETSRRITNNLEDKNFYLGEDSVHWETSPEVGELRPVINYAHAIVNKYSDLLTAGETPGVQMQSPTEDETIKAYASAGENLIYRILDDNNFARKLHYASVNASMLGDAFFHAYWDPNREVGGKKGAAVVDTISPFFIRVGFARNNWDDIEYWIGESYMTPGLIKQRYDIEVPSQYLTVETGGSGGSSTNAPFDNTVIEAAKTYNPMILVLDYHDKEKDCVLVGDQTILVNSNKGNHGLYHIRNRTAPNEPWGYPDLFNIKQTNKLLNTQYAQANEIIATHAGPIIVDKGGVLGGKKLKTRHDIVVTTAPYAPGEGLEYLQWAGNTYPIEKQIESTKAVIHDLAEMPPAAFGSYQPGTTSGFQLTVQMQPTLMRVKIKQNAEWGPNLVELYRYLLKLVLENDKSVKLPKQVADFPIKINWGNPLPREDAREIQNQILLTQNKLVSKETARQDLLIEDVVEENKKIQNETLADAETAGQAQAAVAAAMQPQTTPEQQGQPQMMAPVQPGQSLPNPEAPLPENQRATPQSLNLEGGLSVAPTSKGVV